MIHYLLCARRGRGDETRPETDGGHKNFTLQGNFYSTLPDFVFFSVSKDSYLFALQMFKE